MAWGYFRAEDHGLINVTSVDWMAGQGCYEWAETTILFRPEDGRFFWDTDAGCSCNGPLENMGIDDLKSGTVWELIAELNKELAAFVARDYRTDREKGVVSLEVTGAIETAMKHHRGEV